MIYTNFRTGQQVYFHDPAQDVVQRGKIVSITATTATGSAYSNDWSIHYTVVDRAGNRYERTDLELHKSSDDAWPDEPMIGAPSITTEV